MKSITRCCGLFLVIVTLVTVQVHAKEIADTIYLGGPILTINDEAPRAEAVAVADGLILAVGEREHVLTYQSDSTEIYDLKGRVMLPGFVDSHGHAVMGGLQALSANLLAPPDGAVKDITMLQDTLRTWLSENTERVDKAQLIVGFGYDQSQLKELRHPTRDDLDKVSLTLPVLAIHQSGHLAAINSKGLELFGITAEATDPAGGVYRRFEVYVVKAYGTT